jgi:hypothetical protein
LPARQPVERGHLIGEAAALSAMIEHLFYYIRKDVDCQARETVFCTESQTAVTAFTNRTKRSEDYFV